MTFNVWFLAFSFSFFALPADSANAIPGAEDTNKPAEMAKRTVEAFMQQSRRLRLQYECSGEFLNPDDKNNLHKLSTVF